MSIPDGIFVYDFEETEDYPFGWSDQNGENSFTNYNLGRQSFDPRHGSYSAGRTSNGYEPSIHRNLPLFNIDNMQPSIKWGWQFPTQNAKIACWVRTNDSDGSICKLRMTARHETDYQLLDAYILIKGGGVQKMDIIVQSQGWASSDSQRNQDLDISSYMNTWQLFTLEFVPSTHKIKYRYGSVTGEFDMDAWPSKPFASSGLCLMANGPYELPARLSAFDDLLICVPQGPNIRDIGPAPISAADFKWYEDVGDDWQTFLNNTWIQANRFQIRPAAVLGL